MRIGRAFKSYPVQLSQFADGETEGQRSGSDLAEAEHYRGQFFFHLNQDGLQHYLGRTNLFSVPKGTILAPPQLFIPTSVVVLLVSVTSAGPLQLLYD